MKIFNCIRKKDWKRQARKKKIIGPVRVIEYKTHQSQKDRNNMWIEALAANWSGVPVAFINPYISFQQREKLKSAFRQVKLNRDVALIARTSGSTGEPKIIQRTNRLLLSNVRCNGKKYGMNSRTIAADFINPDSTIGFSQFVSAGIFGAKFIHIDNTLDARAVIDQAIAKRINYFVATAAQWGDICSALEKMRVHWGLKVAVISAGNVTDAVVQTLSRYTTCKIYTDYGSAETGAIANMAVGEKTGSVGKPVPGIIIKIIKPDGRVSKPFEIGEIALQNKNIAAFARTYYRTGDLGYQDKEGYLYVVGRVDNMFKISGYRVTAEQLEKTYDKHPSCVFAVPSSKPGQSEAVIVFETKEHLKKISDYVDVTDPPVNIFCRPRYVFTLSRLPRTASGKIDRVKVKDIFSKKVNKQKNRLVKHPGRTDRYLLSNNLENDILKIWQELLRIRRIDTGENFFHLGGTSLKAMQCASLVSSRFSIFFPVNEIYKNPTIKKIAKIIKASLSKKDKK